MATTWRVATTWKLLRVQCRTMAVVGRDWQLDEPKHHIGNGLEVIEIAVQNKGWSWQDLATG